MIRQPRILLVLLFFRYQPPPHELYSCLHMAQGAPSPHRARASAALALASTVLGIVFKLSLLLIAPSVLNLCSMDTLPDFSFSLFSAANSFFNVARQPLDLLNAYSFAALLWSGLFMSPVVWLLVSICVVSTNLCFLWCFFSLPIWMKKPLDADDISLMVNVDQQLTRISDTIRDAFGSLWHCLFPTGDLRFATFCLLFAFKISLSGWSSSTLPNHLADGTTSALGVSYPLWYTLISLVVVGVVILSWYTALIVYIVLVSLYRCF
jgi:hypothetical protein